MSNETKDDLLRIAKQLGDDPPKRLDKQSKAELIISEFQSFTDNYYSPSSESNNIAAGLRCVNNVYDSDIAYILILDDSINAGRIIAAEFRDGLEGFAGVLLSNIIAPNLFKGIICPGKEYCFTADVIMHKHPAEYEWMYLNGIENFMLSPFYSRTRLVAFIGTCNAKRLYADTTMLRLARAMLTSDLRGITVMGNLTLKQDRYAVLEDNDLVVNMFGGFEICTHRGALNLSSYAPNKCCVMLIYLLLNRTRTVSMRELAEVLWPDQLFDNPGALVKGVAFRLRKLLATVCDKSIVLGKQGTYELSDELVVISDVNNFDIICNQLQRQGHSKKDKQSLYERAIATYRGNLLPNFEDEIWLTGQMSYYQIKYWDLVKDYLALLEESEQYERFFNIASNAMNIVYQDGDIYFMMIRVMLKQGRLVLAKNYYLRGEKLFSHEQKQLFLRAWNKAKLS